MAFQSYSQNFKVAENRDSLMAYLKSTIPPIDQNASAVILYEIGTTDGTNGVDMYHYEIAFKIYNAKNIGNLVDIIIPKKSYGVVKKLKGITYNLEDGNITENKVEKSEIIMEDYTDGLDIVKVSMPGIKDGSVVTYSYEVKNSSMPSSWNFQRDEPVLYSRFNFNRSEMLMFTPMIHTSVEFKSFTNMKKMDASSGWALYAEGPHAFSPHIIQRSWVRKNVPAFKKEDLMGPEVQFVERVKLNYNGVVGPGMQYPIAESWDKHIKEIWHDKILVQAFDKSGFLDETVKNIVKDIPEELDKAKAIFYYVQKNIQNRSYGDDIRKVFEAKQGDQAGINKLLCAMLRNAGLKSDMILLSNKYNDKLSEVLPNPSDITNLITRVEINGVSYQLNAAEKDLPFGYLPLSYYNGYSRIVSKEGGVIELDASLARNISNTIVYLNANKEAGNTYRFKMIREMGVYTGMDFRKAWRSDSTTIKQHFIDRGLDEGAEGEKHMSGLKITDVTFENINEVDKNVRVVLYGTVDLGDAVDMVILDPYFKKIFSENPIRNVNDRKYPVEYDYISQEKYKIYIQLSDKYMFDDYPVGKNIALDPAGLMRYTSSVNIDTARNAAMIQCQFDNKILLLDAKEVGTLSEFYNAIIKQQNQKILLKLKS
jgi:hypothetical protein